MNKLWFPRHMGREGKLRITNVVTGELISYTIRCHFRREGSRIRYRFLATDKQGSIIAYYPTDGTLRYNSNVLKRYKPRQLTAIGEQLVKTAQEWSYD